MNTQKLSNMLPSFKIQIISFSLFFVLFNPYSPLSPQLNKNMSRPYAPLWGGTQKTNTIQPLLIKKSQPNLEDRSFYEKRSANGEY